MTIQLIPKGDQRAGYAPDHDCYDSIFMDGPKYLVIGPKATDSQLKSASSKFNIPMTTLFDFRESLKS